MFIVVVVVVVYSVGVVVGVGAPIMALFTQSNPDMSSIPIFASISLPCPVPPRQWLDDSTIAAMSTGGSLCTLKHAPSAAPDANSSSNTSTKTKSKPSSKVRFHSRIARTSTKPTAAGGLPCSRLAVLSLFRSHPFSVFLPTKRYGGLMIFPRYTSPVRPLSYSEESICTMPP